MDLIGPVANIGINAVTTRCAIGSVGEHIDFAVYPLTCSVKILQYNRTRKKLLRVGNNCFQVYHQHVLPTRLPLRSSNEPSKHVFRNNLFEVKSTLATVVF